MAIIIFKVDVPQIRNPKLPSGASNYIPGVKVKFNTGAIGAFVDQTLACRYTNDYKFHTDESHDVYALYSSRSAIGEILLRFRVQVGNEIHTLYSRVYVLPWMSIEPYEIILGKEFMKQYNMLLEYAPKFQERVFFRKGNEILQEINYRKK